MAPLAPTTEPVAASPPPPWQELLRDALRYWEPRRLGYNAVLGAIVLGWVVFTWPHFRSALAPGPLAQLLVLAALANLCYCAAYLIDVPVQHSRLRGAWRARRGALWLFGTAFAALITCYWIADEIYPAVS